MPYEQYLTPEQIKRIVHGLKEEAISVSVNLTKTELEAFCSFLKLSQGYEEAGWSLINYPEFEKLHDLSATHRLMDAVSHMKLVFCAAEKGMTVDAYITEYGD
jgi:hypothetical protein